MSEAHAEGVGPVGSAVDTWIDRLRQEWASTTPPVLEEFLAQAGAMGPQQLASVLHADREEAWKRGQRRLAEDYLRRFPALNADPEAALLFVYREFLLREHLGETPLPQEFLQRFPHLANDLQEQFSVHQAVEHVASATEQWPKVPGFEILEELGRGGMGVVYKARQLNLNRVVALKMILAGQFAGAEERRRFRAEADAVAKLNHANIVQIYEWGEYQQRPYFALEFVAGGSLAARLAGIPLPEREAAQVAEVLARGIEAAHQVGIVHRDLKPANVLLAPGAESLLPKVTDFGLAKRLDDGAGVTSPSGAIIGTYSYMAPEQAAGKTKEVGPLADVYALGAVLYEMLTGRPPFRAATVLETLHQVVALDPLPPSRLQPRLAHDLETICLKCLQKEPAKRYASAAALADDLQRFRNGEPIRARPIPWWERGLKWARRRPAAAGLVVVSLTAALLLLVGGIVYVTERQVALEKTENALETAENRRRQAEAEQQRADKSFTHAVGAADSLVKEVAESLDKLGHTGPQVEEILRRAEGIYEVLLEDPRGSLQVKEHKAQMLIQLSELYLKLYGNQPLKALSRANAAFQLYGELLVQNPRAEKWRRGQAQALKQRGYAFYWNSAYAQSEEAYRQALEILNSLLEQSPQSPDLRLEKVAVLWRYGLLILAMEKAERSDEAQQHFLAARQLLEQLPALSGRLAYERDYLRVRVLGGLADWNFSKNKLVESLKLREQALQLAWQRKQQHPGNVRVLHDLSVAHGHLAQNLVALGQLTAAEPLARTQLDLRQQLYAQDRDNARYRRDVGVAIRELGDILEELGRWRDILPLYRDQALPLFRQLAEAPDANPEARMNYAEFLYYVANVYRALGQWPQADRWYKQALEYVTAERKANGKKDFLLRTWLAVHLEHTQALLLQGRVEEASGHLEPCRKALANLPNFQRERAFWLGIQGNFLLAQKQAEEALKAYEEALELGRSASRHLRRGTALEALERWHQAQNAYDLARKLWEGAGGEGGENVDQQAGWARSLIKLGQLRLRISKDDAEGQRLLLRGRDRLHQLHKENRLTWEQQRWLEEN